MADPQQASAEAERVAAAKARLRYLAEDMRPGHYVMVQASNLMRERPWHGIGLALLAGVALGLAPREAVKRLALLASPAVRLLGGARLGDRSRVRASGRANTSAGVRRRR